MTRILTRRYDAKDRAAVLAIFDSNLPDYFGAGDREWLEETLDDPDGPAFVVDVSCPLLSGPSTMRVWIKEGTTNACEKAQAGRDHREAA